MDLKIRPYGKTELYNELTQRGYPFSYKFFIKELYTVLSYTGSKLDAFRRSRSVTVKELKQYIEECGVPGESLSN